jgi:hypothetical protein
MTERDEQHVGNPSDADEIPLGDMEVGDEQATNVVGGGAAVATTAPAESISMDFSKVQQTYTPQR